MTLGGPAGELPVQPVGGGAVAAPGLRARAPRAWPAAGSGRDRLLVALGLLGLLLASVWVRTRALGSSLWIDEGLTVGVSHHPLSEIPRVLRGDGAPPLYYVVLHLWMGVFGDREARTHLLSVGFALAAVPAGLWAGWSLFGRRAGWICAVLLACNPLLTAYAAETRMYSLLVLLGIVTSAAFVHAFVYRRRRSLPLFGVGLAAMLYTHNWAEFFAVGLGLAFLGCLAAAAPEERRGLLRDGVLGFGGAVLLFLPWVPTLIYQAGHTGAPWALHPSSRALLHDLYKTLGDPKAAVALVLGTGAGVAALRGRPWSREALAAAALLTIAVVTLGVAFGYCQVSRAWASRYFTVLLGPLLLLAALGLSRARGIGLAALALVVLSAIGIPHLSELQDKSNVGHLSAVVRPRLHRGDLVVVTQPEQIADARYYLGPRYRYATTLGPAADPRAFDWRSAVARLHAARPAATIAGLLGGLRPGQQLLVLSAVTRASGWTAPWTHLVRLRTIAWRRALAKDPAVHRVYALHPRERSSESTVAATLYVKR